MTSYHTIPYDTIPYRTVPNRTVPCRTVPSDAFHFQISCQLIAGIRQFLCVQPAGCGYYCAKGEFYANFYSFINSHTIRMHFNSQSKLNLCFRLMVHLFDMLRIPMRYLGNICQITVAIG